MSDKQKDERPFLFVGLDIETTGLDPDLHGMIQFGVALDLGRFWSLDIDPFKKRSTWHIDPGALDVNKFTIERIKAGWSVDDAATGMANWLKKCDINPNEHKIVPVGWNVSSFDMQFVKRQAPELAKYFHYQMVDLNSCCFMLGAHKEFKTALRREVKGIIKQRLNGLTEHDAGYDAVEAIICFTILRNRLNNLIPSVTTIFVG